MPDENTAPAGETPAGDATSTTTDPPAAPPAPDDSLKKALDAERNARKAAEKALKDQARASMTEQERAVAEAEERGRAETRALFAGKLVESKFEAKAAGRPVDVAALLEGVDKSKFVTDDGEVDEKAIESWLNRVAPPAAPADPNAPPAVPNLGQGNVGGGKVGAYGIGDDDALLRDLKAKVGIQ